MLGLHARKLGRHAQSQIMQTYALPGNALCPGHARHFCADDSVQMILLLATIPVLVHHPKMM